MSKDEIELLELDIKIIRFEAMLESLNEQRRELINYLELNKPQPNK